MRTYASLTLSLLLLSACREAAGPVADAADAPLASRATHI